MTAVTAAWRQPQWQTSRAQDGREYVVEAMLRLGSEEYEQTEWALATLRQLRLDLTLAQVVERVERLLDLAEIVAGFENAGYEAYCCAAGEYRDALAEFAGTLRSAR